MVTPCRPSSRFTIDQCQHDRDCLFARGHTIKLARLLQRALPQLHRRLAESRAIDIPVPERIVDVVGKPPVAARFGDIQLIQASERSSRRSVAFTGDITGARCGDAPSGTDPNSPLL